jgi:hypothetical protein
MLKSIIWRNNGKNWEKYSRSHLPVPVKKQFFPVWRQRNRKNNIIKAVALSQQGLLYRFADG